MSLNPTLKTVFLLRHAKAEMGSAAQDDRARGLTEAGKLAAEALGKSLRQAELPGLTLCSTATRARDTLACLEAGLERSLNAQNREALYLASAAELGTMLAALPEDHASVMLIGHNPGLHELAVSLARRGEERLLDELHLHFPPSALAVLRFEAARWPQLRQARGELVEFITAPTLQEAA